MRDTLARFEAAYRQGECPRIDGYVQAAIDAVTRRDLLVELIHTEMELRWQSGEAVRVEEYLARYPNLLDDDAVLLGLIQAEYWLRHRHQTKQTVLPEEYQRRFPRVAGNIEAEVGQTVVMSSSSFYENESSAQGETCSFQTGAGAELAVESAQRRPFASLTWRILRLLKGHATPREFAAGECLMRQGNAGSGLMIICHGNVEIRVADAGGDSYLIDVSGSGGILGEMSLLTDEPCTASAIAAGPVRVLSIPTDEFHALAKEHPPLLQAMAEIVAYRLGRFSRDALSGKTFFGCAIRQRLGRGGMSVVYEADELAMGRRVALKMMSHRLVNDAVALQSFQREADLIETFSHPHIIRMYGRFEAFRTYFIILEFAEGESLDDAIRRRGALPEAEVRKILAQLAGALAYAHAHHVLHRDLKPSNIMLDASGNVKLMDFGLATPLDNVDSAVAVRVAGTPQYMAPEQVHGGELTPATDYFGLGCVAYEMLMGKQLFRDRTFSALLERVRTWTPIPFGALCPQAGGVLAALLETSLHPDPGRRRVDLDLLAHCAYAPQ